MAKDFITFEQLQRTVENLKMMIEEAQFKANSTVPTNNYRQVTRLNLTSNSALDLKIPYTTNFKLPPLEVLKLSAGGESVLNKCQFKSDNSADYNHDADFVEFDGAMRLRSTRNVALTTLELNDGLYYCESEQFNLADYKDLTFDFQGYSGLEIEQTAATETSVTVTGTGYGIKLTALGGGYGQWQRVNESQTTTSAAGDVDSSLQPGEYGISLISTGNRVGTWSRVQGAALESVVEMKNYQKPYKLILISNGVKYSTSGIQISDIEEADNNLPSFEVMKALGKVRLGYYSSSNLQPSCKMNFVPQIQTVTAKNLISLDGEVHNVFVNANTSGSASVKILVTTDLERYYTYSDGWIETDIADISTQGLTIEILEIIPSGAWQTLTSSDKTINFPYCLSKSVIEESCEVVDVTLTAEISGSWSKAVHNVDYTYAYTSNTNLKVTILTDGSYKINYEIIDEEGDDNG